MDGELNVLCAGAVKGLVLALQGDFERATGLRLHATFGAVGAIREALGSGAPCDVFIATDRMIESLQASGELRAGTEIAIGRVQSAIAGRASAPTPRIDDAESLKAALLAASALYFPDATLSTAGAHVATILERLGLRAALASRLRMFANGATATRELADSGRDRLHAGDRDPRHAGPPAGRCAAAAVRGRDRSSARSRGSPRRQAHAGSSTLSLAHSSAGWRRAGGFDGASAGDVESHPPY